VRSEDWRAPCTRLIAPFYQLFILHMIKSGGKQELPHVFKQTPTPAFGTRPLAWADRENDNSVSYRQCPGTQVYPPAVFSQCAATQTDVLDGINIQFPGTHA
jgi:hypothetical protein